MCKKINSLAIQMYLKGKTFLSDTSGAETTEVIGWIAIVVIIVAAIIGLLGGEDGLIGKLLKSIFGKAQSTFEGFFPG